LLTALELEQFADFELPELEAEENPLAVEKKFESWPLDPLGERHRSVVEAARDRTLQAIDKLAVESEGIALGDKIQSHIDLLIAERDEALGGNTIVRLPVRVPASRFKDFISDLPSVLARYHRPMPQQPYKQTRTGTLFHSWVEARFGARELLDDQHEGNEISELDGLDIDQLKANFEASRWANLVPLEIEREIQLTIEANTFICKIDAVFKTENGVEVIDWKTGKKPKDKQDAELRALQLSLYRLAYSRFSGVPIEQIEASFYFVADDAEVKPERLFDESELLDLWRKTL
jgi:DNA helicase-2/ATP-dependent DNA helicase PcrA